MADDRETILTLASDSDALKLTSHPQSREAVDQVARAITAVKLEFADGEPLGMNASRADVEAIARAAIGAISTLDTIAVAAEGSWQLITAMADKYDGILLLAAPELIDGDWNPEGVNIGWWQDDQGWKSTAWSNHQDCSYDIIVNPTHFQRIAGPYTADERAAFEAAAIRAGEPS